MTVTAVDDAAAEGIHTSSITHTVTSADSNYDGISIASVTANITDNDTAGVTITETGGTTDVTEGGATDNYDVVLNSQPATGTTVTITIATTDGQTATTPTSLVFDEANWNVPQSVTVTAVDDAAQEGSPHIGSITHTTTSADSNYDGIGVASVTANITDNDTAGVTITETGGTTDVTEGGATDNYDVVLNSQPATGTTVTITINTADGQTTTAPTSLVFDDTNWNLAQSVIVTAVDDVAAEGIHTSSITHTVTSTDSNYDGVGTANVTTNITDNETVGVTITESGGTTDVDEGGPSDSYDVVLDSQPQTGTTVTITIATTDGQTVTAPTSLVFDDTNWNLAQSVNVTAVDDTVAESSPHAGSITHTAASTDANYEGIAINDVVASITDNDVSEDSFLYISLKNSATLPGGLTIANEDIVEFDGTNFRLVFDGSDVGLASANVDALAIIGTNEILMSFRAPENIPGIAGQVQDTDIVKFTATQLGDTTSGTFELFFRGSDVGFTPTTEDVDAIDLHPDGRLIVSTIGNFTVPGLTGRDEDLIAFTPNTPGDYSAGTWAFYIDGSDVELGREDVYGVSLNPNGNIHLSVTNAFAVTGVSGTDADVFTLIPTQLGANTIGSYNPTLLFDGGQFGLDALDVNGIDIPHSGGAGGDALRIIAIGDAFDSFVVDEIETLDISAEGKVTALDALLVINALSILNSGSLDDGRIDEMDANQDDNLTALDALVVVNYLSRASVSQRENLAPQGESLALPAPTNDDPVVDRKPDAVEVPEMASLRAIDGQSFQQPSRQHVSDALRSLAIQQLLDETQIDLDLDDTLAADIMTNMVESSHLF